ncbi:MAG: hypothetical protein E7464_04745, partial [Ruminococcaceae bacterium]|nr:hypothetical protein [Oscillospiraceae bacterium]
EIVVVCLQYTLDEFNDEKDEPTGGDEIPDYKQVQFLYAAGEHGSVAPVREIVTIDGSDYTDVAVSAELGSEATAEEGYALDKWTYEANSDANAEAALNQEGSKILPAVENADGGKTYTFEASFAEDKKGDEDDGGEDDIPDKYQVFVEFRSANEEQGTVTGKIRQTFTFEEESGDVAPTLNGVRIWPKLNYTFDYWVRDNGTERLDNAQVQRVIENVSGGTTIVFTANFALDMWTDAEETEDPDDEDTDVTGDGIPDYRQFRVIYLSEDLKMGAVKPEVEIFTLNDDIAEYAAKGSSAIAKPHYAFDHWNYDGDATADFDPSQVTIAPKLSKVTGGETYTFSAAFGEDNDVDPGVDPDPDIPGDEVPDVHQAVVTYRVVGGFWADGTDADIQKVFTLREYKQDEATGKWEWTDLVPVPTLGEIPEVTPSDAHTGAWDAEISAETPVTKDVIYTYTFTPLPTYSVSYDLNGGIGAQNVDYSTVHVVEGTVITVKAAPVQEGSLFKGYLVGETTYQPGDSITVTADVELVAQWELVVPGTGTITLTKVDSADNSTTLPNVMFELYNADGTQVGTYTTDKNGEVTVEDLPAGEHYWVEIRPAEGYQLDSRKYEFTVNGGQTTDIVIENTRTPVPEVFSGEHYAYIIGKNDGLVHPEDNITRAEVATIFFRMLDEETRNKYMTKTNSFSDVNEGMWFNAAVSTMAAMGIVNGTPDGTFQPHKNITRAEFAAIAARFDTNGNTTGVSFSDIYGHWAQKEINIAANNGWVLGYVNGEFKPDQDISRAEAMAMVNRVLQRIPQGQEDLLPEMVTWPDNMDTTKWYYLTVQEATNSHGHERKPNGYEVWTELKEVPDWAALER